MCVYMYNIKHYLCDINEHVSTASFSDELVIIYDVFAGLRTGARESLYIHKGLFSILYTLSLALCLSLVVYVLLYLTCSRISVNHILQEKIFENIYVIKLYYTYILYERYAHCVRTFI